MTSEQQLFQTDFFATIINCHNYFFKQKLQCSVYSKKDMYECI